MAALLEQVRLTIQRYKLLDFGEKVVVGVSGGPDSLALLCSLLELQKELGISLHVAHLDHRLRENSAQEAAYVRRLAQQWGLPVTVEARDVRTYQREHKLSLEEAAREVRYRFLREVAGKVGATKIAVGHQADDQAETLLLNLLRGSGLTGLKAMLPHREGIIRPLLFITREEIEAYCRDKGLVPCRDPSNLDPAYRRNKIRQELIPWLAREFNPAIVRVLARTAVLLAEEEAFLEEVTRESLAKVIKEQGRGYLQIEREGLLSLPPALERRVLRAAVLSLGGGVEFYHVEHLRELLRAGSGALTLPQGLQAKVSHGFLLLKEPNVKGEEEILFCHPLKVPGVTPLPEIGRRLRIEILPPPAKVITPPWEAWVDRDKLPGPLWARNWRPGDRFRPLGMKGTKKLQDLFVDAGINTRERRRLPVVVSGENIVWVAGVRLAEDFKITPETRWALHLILEEEALD
ncbi:tRNA(Ile)-lysidine synthase [Thermanaeromonas toyohensis ToBE]|uniref:tRNA(Ile)-lysidine synthase n=1 Tax=Thermanaeromonas toyohensis ToBE TaxID=698762 RepID=A0A1W1W366_9FIRM|nr:tRNA lysidine(34) synthetase TilS [Thermanaeromonas toyohensis]SMC00069.1 tRNA(Ile)-lysidine synthase [Thermanaeromonas toyohensis ToBE]